MPESQQLVLIQHHFLQKNLFSENQEQGSWAECSRQNIITPREHLADSCCVLSFKMPVIQSDLKILSVPLQDSYCFRKSSCLIHEIKSRSSWLSQQFPKWSCCSGWWNHSVMAVHNHAFKKSPLCLKTTGLVQFLTLIGACDIDVSGRLIWYIILIGTCFGLRWFTPTCEVPLCGHATLASAAVLFNCLGEWIYTIPLPVPSFQIFFPSWDLRLWKQSSFVISCKTS